MRDSDIIAEAVEIAQVVNRTRQYHHEDTLKELDNINHHISLCPTYEGLVKLSQLYLDKAKRLNLKR